MKIFNTLALKIREGTDVDFRTWLIGISIVGVVALFSFGGYLMFKGGIPDFLKGPPTKGIVLEKKHEDARHYEEWDSCKTQYPVTRTRTSFDGKSVETYTDMECVGGMVQRYDDEDWKLHLKDCKTNSDGTQGKCRTGWREVDSEAYKAVQVGSYYGKKVS